MTKSTIDLVTQAKSVINEITVEQANKMLNDGALALDVRELQEYHAGHIPNATHISRGTLEFMIETHPQFQDKTHPTVVYCKTGGRSALATATLQELGFSSLYSLTGGFDSWREDEGNQAEIIV
jgi:rhodanese-related sulfurtransferase